jgi:2-hydroxy-6-oxonona-2,4-dienedioate hydrolase
MKEVGTLFAILLSIAVIYFVVSAWRHYQKELADARQRLSVSDIINTNLGPVEYATSGRGEPIIIVHGAGGGFDQGLGISEVWIDQGYERIAISRFGYLRSPLPPEPSHALQADIYAELMDSLHIRRAVIMGASAGGPSTLQFALRHPDRCRALILVAAISHERLPLAWHHKLFFDIFFSKDFVYWNLVNLLPSAFYSAFGIPPDVQASLSPAQRDSIFRFFRSILPTSLRKQGMDFDRADRVLNLPIQEIKAPVLAIHSLDDNIVPYANAQYIKEKIPHAQVLTFEKGGHLFIGQFSRIKQGIAEFLQKERK